MEALPHLGLFSSISFLLGLQQSLFVTDTNLWTSLYQPPQVLINPSGYSADPPLVSLQIWGRNACNRTGLGQFQIYHIPLSLLLLGSPHCSPFRFFGDMYTCGTKYTLFKKQSYRVVPAICWKNYNWLGISDQHRTYATSSLNQESSVICAQESWYHEWESWYHEWLPASFREPRVLLFICQDMNWK